MRKNITFPLTKADARTLHAGDMCYASGTLYTARDAAHKRMYESMERGEALPISLKDTVLYYLGPSPAKPGQVIGSAGPTTASRMDKYTPRMLAAGVTGVIGKGKRSKEVRESLKKEGAVYFAAIGGAGALLSKCIKEATVVAYEDLGTEAIRKLRVENLPVVVIMDTEGRDYYEEVESEV
ncbi:fumarate hydratase subunit beta [Lachnospiraceae bacterium XBB1006]|nr:fumarate hydratase subunit beta [Lachnospiraceae bacterium XBB1006]